MAFLKTWFFTLVSILVGLQFDVRLTDGQSGNALSSSSAVTPASVESLSPSSSSSSPPLLVIVLDGFRWNYGLPKFAINSSRADYLVPVFPSLRYPNLYSLLTGLYPEQHGIVADVMYDADRREFFSANDDGFYKSYWWNGSAPIWATVKSDGNHSRRVSVFSLPICGVSLPGEPPDECEVRHGVNPNEALEKDLNDAIHKIASGATDFALIYSDILSKSALMNGPDSWETMKGVASVDQRLEDVLRLIEKLGLHNKLNMIVTSTHGMTAVDSSPARRIRLGSAATNDSETGINFDDVEFILSHGAFVSVYPKMDKMTKVFDALNKLEGLHVYKRKDIPKELHIKYHNRTAPIVLIAKKGFYIEKATFTGKEIPAANANVDFGVASKAVSGYDPNEVQDMRGIFYARGPGFRNATVESVDAVDVHQLIECVLNVTDVRRPAAHTRQDFCSLLTVDCPRLCPSDHRGLPSAAAHSRFYGDGRWWLQNSLAIMTSTCVAALWIHS